MKIVVMSKKGSWPPVLLTFHYPISLDYMILIPVFFPFGTLMASSWQVTANAEV